MFIQELVNAPKPVGLYGGSFEDACKEVQVYLTQYKENTGKDFILPIYIYSNRKDDTVLAYNFTHLIDGVLDTRTTGANLKLEAYVLPE